MAKEIRAFEDLKILKTSDLSDSQVRSFEGGAKPWAAGEYVVLPQEHFSVEVEFDGNKFSSDRILAFKLNPQNEVEYIRAWKVRNFNDSCFDRSVLQYAVATEMRDGHRRITRGQDVLKGQMIRATSSMIPARIENKRLHITQAFIMNVMPRIVGAQAVYEGDATNGYDVAVDENGNAKFQMVSLTPFEVSERSVTNDLIARCKEALANDSVLSKVKLEC